MLFSLRMLWREKRRKDTGKVAPGSLVSSMCAFLSVFQSPQRLVPVVFPSAVSLGRASASDGWAPADGSSERSRHCRTERRESSQGGSGCSPTHTHTSLCTRPHSTFSSWKPCNQSEWLSVHSTGCCELKVKTLTLFQPPNLMVALLMVCVCVFSPSVWGLEPHSCQNVTVIGQQSVWMSQMYCGKYFYYQLNGNSRNTMKKVEFL